MCGCRWDRSWDCHEPGPSGQGGVTDRDGQALIAETRRGHERVVEDGNVVVLGSWDRRTSRCAVSGVGVFALRRAVSEESHKGIADATNAAPGKPD